VKESEKTIFCPECSSFCNESWQKDETTHCFFCGEAIRTNTNKEFKEKGFSSKLTYFKKSVAKSNIELFDDKSKKYDQLLVDLGEFGEFYNAVADKLRKTEKVIKELDGKSFMGGSLTMRIILFGFSLLLVVLSRLYSGSTTTIFMAFLLVGFGVPFVFFLKKNKRDFVALSSEIEDLEKVRLDFIKECKERREDLLSLTVRNV
jgi:hypothetical protein